MDIHQHAVDYRVVDALIVLHSVAVDEHRGVEARGAGRVYALWGAGGGLSQGQVWVQGLVRPAMSLFRARGHKQGTTYKTIMKPLACHMLAIFPICSWSSLGSRCKKLQNKTTISDKSVSKGLTENIMWIPFVCRKRSERVFNYLCIFSVRSEEAEFRTVDVGVLAVEPRVWRKSRAGAGASGLDNWTYRDKKEKQWLIYTDYLGTCSKNNAA